MATNNSSTGALLGTRADTVGHWFAASLARQYDALVHFDVTRAVEPLERSVAWRTAEPAETYPSAL
jgi:erythromycin esterase-like protein